MWDDAATRLGVAMLLAGLPGLVRYWRGRRLLRRLDDPLLPELYLQTVARLTLVDTAALAVSIALAWKKILLVLGVWVLARLVGLYPVRRRLYGETWGLLGYLGFFGRVFLATATALLGLLAAPVLVTSVPADRAGGAAALATLVLFGLFALQPRLLRWAFSARPLARPGLDPLFAGVLAKSALASAAPQDALRPVAILEGGPRGGRWANALALPSWRRPAVLFGRDLLDALDPAEVQAIFAHEVAHLEHYDRARLRRLGLVVTGAVLGSALVVPLVARAGKDAGPLVIGAWIVGVLVGLVLRARRRQRNETASDLRALALGADAEALISGLSKLYRLARVPRRLDPAVERGATHPSLARRIRDLRRAAGLAAPRLEPRAFCAAGAPGRWVELDEAGVHWLEGVAADCPADGRRERAARRESIAWSEVGELRVVADLRSRRSADAACAVLRARTVAGRLLELPLAAPDVAPLQDLLDRVDARLGAAPPFAPHPLWVRVLGVLALLVAAAPAGSWLMIPVALAALLVPGGSAAVVLGVAGLGSALLALRPGASHLDPALLALIVGAEIWFALCALALARQWLRRGGESVEPRGLWAVLGGSWAIAWAALALDGTSTVTLHAALQASSAAVLAPLLLAAAWSVARRAAVRRLASLPALASALALVAGSNAGGGLWVHDPLLERRGPTLAAGTALGPSRSAEIPLAPDRFWLAPDGASFLAEVAVEEDDASANEVWWGRFDVAPSRLVAREAVFAGAQRLVVVRPAAAGGGAEEIAGIDLAQPPGSAAVWTLPIPPKTEAHLQWLSAGGGEADGWALIEVASSAGVVRLRSGDIEGHERPVETWTLPSAEGAGYFTAWIASRDGVVGVRHLYALPPPEPWAVSSAILRPTRGPQWRRELFLFPHHDEPERLLVTDLVGRCLPGGPTGVLCTGEDAERSSVWAIGERGPRALVTVSGGLSEIAADAGHVLAVRNDGRVVLVDFDRARITPIGVPFEDESFGDTLTAVSASQAGVIVKTASGSRVDIFALR